MKREPVRIYNRYTHALEEEAIAGERLIRWTYGTVPGRILNAILISRRFLSRLVGWYMRQPGSAKRIRPFIEQYHVDDSEFRLPVEAFRSFNDFFCRELQEGARPVNADPRSVVFPADGRHFAWENIGGDDWIFMKGRHWNLRALLGDDEALVRRFTGGTLVLSRLCPLDYHHFHYPVGGVAGEPVAFEGPLYSVNPISLRRSLQPLIANYRCRSLVRSRDAGLVCLLEIGATNVGSIHHQPLPASRQVRKGDPKGWFEFGGSSVITLFEPGKLRLCDDLKAQSARGIELYSHTGDLLGWTT